MHKKAQALSLNTIIVAIVVLIVLVVLIMIFTGYFGARFTPEITSCRNAGGDCLSACEEDAFGEQIRPLSASCLTTDGKKDPSLVCCPRGLGAGLAPSTEEQCGGVGEACCITGDECKDRQPCGPPSEPVCPPTASASNSCDSVIGATCEDIGTCDTTTSTVDDSKTCPDITTQECCVPN